MIFVLVIVGIAAVGYSYMLGYGLGAAGIAEVIPSYGIAVTSLFTLFFTTLKTNGVLFGYKDYEMLMALPIKTSTVIASRFMAMYIMNLLFTFLVMLPMGASYVIFCKPGFGFYPVWFLGILIAPLIPTTIAVVLGSLVILFSSRFRYANVVTIVVSFGLVIGVLLTSFSAGQINESEFLVSQFASIGEMLTKQLHKIYPPAYLFHQSINQGSLVFLLLFAAISILWYFVFVKLVAKRYKKMNTGLMTYHAKSNFKMSALKTESPVKAVMRKELKRFLNCPIYILNTGMGILMSLVACGGCFVLGPDKMEAYLGMPGIFSELTKILPFAIACIVNMTCTTAVSLSLEGKNLWILKSLPLNPITVYKGKIGLNLLLTIPASLLCSLLLRLRIPMSALQTVFLFITPVIYSSFVSVAGMWVNLKFPNYQWASETVVVKQSMSSMIGIFGGMVNGAVPLLILIFLPAFDPLLLTAGFTILEGVGGWFLYQHLKQVPF